MMSQNGEWFIKEFQGDPSIAFVFEGRAFIRKDQSITISAKSTSSKVRSDAVQRLKSHIENGQLTEIQVAKDLGITKATLSHWFSGRNLPSRRILSRIEAYLGAQNE